MVYSFLKNRERKGDNPIETLEGVKGDCAPVCFEYFFKFDILNMAIWGAKLQNRNSEVKHLVTILMDFFIIFCNLSDLTGKKIAGSSLIRWDF